MTEILHSHIPRCFTNVTPGSIIQNHINPYSVPSSKTTTMARTSTRNPSSSTALSRSNLANPSVATTRTKRKCNQVVDAPSAERAEDTTHVASHPKSKRSQRSHVADPVEEAVGVAVVLEEGTPVVTRSKEKKGKQSQAVNPSKEACAGRQVKHSRSAKSRLNKSSSSASLSSTVKKVTTPSAAGNVIVAPSSTHSMARRSHTINGMSLL